MVGNAVGYRAMWTGRRTLGEIEKAIAKLQHDEGDLDAALASATTEAERLRHERSQAFRALARVKLGEIEARRLVRDLDAAEARAVELLASRRLRLEAINAQRTTAVGEVGRAQNERDAAAEAVESALGEVEELRDAAERQVKSTAAWVDANKAYEAADQVAGEAKIKAEQSAAELAAKKRPYDEDRLFSYLWSNGYATRHYRSSGIVRMVDRMIADFIGYDDARANYAMLIEIPIRLKEHAEDKGRIATELQAALAAIERQAMVEAGVQAKEQTLSEVRHRLATADDMVQKKQRLVQDLDRVREALVDGTGDTSFAQALQGIASADAQDDVATLYREARRTKTSADDKIVARIKDNEGDLQRIEAELAKLRQLAQTLAQRRLEVERLRDRFRSSGFDHPSTTFRNGNELSDVLGQMLEGAVRSGILWDLLRGGFSTRRRRGRPDFGAPTFPFPFPMPGGGSDGARGGEWREPQTRGGWLPPSDFPRLPSAGPEAGFDVDSDEFTTGGSF